MTGNITSTVTISKCTPLTKAEKKLYKSASGNAVSLETGGTITWSEQWHYNDHRQAHGDVAGPGSLQEEQRRRGCHWYRDRRDRRGHQRR